MGSAAVEFTKFVCHVAEKRLLVVFGRVESIANHIPNLAPIAGCLGVTADEHGRNLRIGQFIHQFIEMFRLHGARRGEVKPMVIILIIENATNRRS